MNGTSLQDNTTENWAGNSTYQAKVPDGCIVVQRTVADFIPWDNPDNIVSREVEEITVGIVSNVMLHVLFIFFCAPTNIINMIVFYKHGLKERINFCVFILALIDFLFMLQAFLLYLDSPIILLRRLLGYPSSGSKILMFLNQINFHGLYGLLWSSHFVSTLIACERCYCIVNPLRANSVLKTRTTAIIVGVACPVITGGYFFCSGKWTFRCIYDPVLNTTSIELYPFDFYLQNPVFVDTLQGYVYGLGMPLLFMVVVMSCTVVTVVKLRKLSAWREQASSATIVSARDLALTRMLVGTSILFIVCSLPNLLRNATLLIIPDLNAGGSLSQEITTQCPDGWLAWQDFCYLFVNSTTVTWSQAGDECAARRAHLLRVETSDEYEFVKKGLLLNPSDAYWTALNDLPLNQPPNSNKVQGTGVFLWGSDEYTDDSVVKQHWDREPDNTDFKDCVVIGMQGTMAVNDCAKRHGYICQVTKQTSEDCPMTDNYWWQPGVDGTTCYFYSNVSSWQQLVTWDQARKVCEAMTPFTGDTSRKAVMLAITSQDTKTFLAEQLPFQANTRQQYWTGLNDKNTEGSFQWAGNEAGYALQTYGTFLAEQLPFQANTRQQYWTGLNDKNTEGSFQWAGNEGTQYDAQYVNWRVEPNNLGGKEFCGALLPKGEWNDRNCDDKLNFACRLSLPDKPQEWNMGCGSWTRAGHKCMYVYSAPTKTWQDARSYCQAMNGDLMKFDNEDDTLWLKIQSSTTVMTLPGYWIGLNDIEVENTFRWADGSWADGYLLDWDVEPNNFARYGRFQQDCAVMAVDGNFIDISCNKQKAGTICEEATDACAQGWQNYQGHCYLLDATYRLKSEAQGFCHDQSATGTARLFALNTQDEKTWLVTQIGKVDNRPYAFWSDLTDQQLEGDWHWAMDADDDPVAIQKLVTWTNEPNNFLGNEDCVMVDMNGHLNDANCASKTGFVCQRDLHS
ncbi:hypothetical protein BaRGS_00007992, partial [Batillaria attramentaria]